MHEDNLAKKLQQGIFKRGKQRVQLPQVFTETSYPGGANRGSDIIRKRIPNIYQDL